MNKIMTRTVAAIAILAATSWCTDEKLIKLDKHNMIYDKQNELLWQNNREIKNMNWPDADKYCDNFELAGLSNWRLPVYRELKNVVDLKIYELFNQNNSDTYWSISSGDSYQYGGNSRYVVDIRNGNESEIYVAKSIQTRCVRKTKPTEIQNIIDQSMQQERDRKKYETSSQTNTISAYKDYLKQFPNGEYASSARSNIQYLESEAQFRALLQSKSPQTMYIEAGKQERNGNTSKANKLYEAIIDRFPNSDFAVKASDKLTGAIRTERAESNRRSQSRQECENNKNACLAGCGTYISGADSHNSAVWSCNDKCKQISCY